MDARKMVSAMSAAQRHFAVMASDAERLQRDSSNFYLDSTLRLQRGAGGVLLRPDREMCSTVEQCLDTPADKHVANSCPGCGGGGLKGFLHFSVVTTVAEEAAWQALGEDHAVPAAITVNLVRPGTLTGGDVIGEGVAVKAGRGIMVAEGKAYQGGKLLATVTATFARYERRS
jgi:acyl-coenzyme A thioesterase PaaI-like protein